MSLMNVLDIAASLFLLLGLYMMYVGRKGMSGQASSRRERMDYKADIEREARRRL